jgi:chromosome partitioning protein
MAKSSAQKPIKPMVSVMEDLPRSISLDDITDISSRATAMLEAIREKMLAPHPAKKAPVYSLAQVAELCRMERTQAKYIAAKGGDIPSGKIVGNNYKREFTLNEAQQWVRELGPFGARPAGAKGKILAVGNFKGGVTKTTSTMTLAQGLSLRGRRVLLLDLDPQASLTALNGILADSEVNEDDTVMPLIYGNETSLEYAIRPTYWGGIDLIPSSSQLFNAEFFLPTKQVKFPSFEFWNVLLMGLQPLMDKYDVVIIDTPPALSYMTINAFMAADVLIVPTPPNALDFASSTQFWSLFSDLTFSMRNKAPSLASKRYDFIDVLLAKTDHTQAATNVVREWIRKTYGDLVLPTEIPITAVAQSAAAEFGTVYDISSYSGSNKTYQRAREAYDSFTELVDRQLMAVWSKGN